MANSLNKISAEEISQKALETLNGALPILNSFTTDFSDEVAQEGGSIVTHYASIPAGAEITTGYADAAQDASLNAVTINLGNVKGAVIGFTDSEWSKSNVDLYGRFINPLVKGIANKVISDIVATVTAVNFTNASTVTAANFNTDAVIDIGAALSGRGVAFGERSLILNSAYFNALLKDEAVKNASAYAGNDVIQFGKLSNVVGFGVNEYAAMSIPGFACGKEAICIATRVPATPDQFTGEIATATDDESGLALQIRKWYSADNGKYYLAGLLFAGVAVGEANALQRIVTA